MHLTDECVFHLGKNSGLVRVWRRRGERHLDEWVVPSFASSCVSVMVWGYVTFDCKVDLVDIRGNWNGPRYVDEILEPHVEPHINNHALNDHPIFVQDGATPHTARISQDYLHNAAIDDLLGPSKNLDLNIIENLWSHITRSINERPRNAAQIRNAVQDRWRRLSQARVQRLVCRLCRRVRPVVEADGWHKPR